MSGASVRECRQRRIRSPATLGRAAGHKETDEHHQAEPEEEEHQTAESVLDPDHFMVGGENIFSPPPQLVVFVLGGVCVWIVMGVDRSGSVHFRKSYAVISKRKRDLQSLKFAIRVRKRRMACFLGCAKFPRAKRGEAARNHSSRYGLLLCRYRGARSPFVARQTRRCGWR